MYSIISKLSPLTSITYGTFLFVFGQYFLRNGLDHKNYFILTWAVFSFTMGLVGIITSILVNNTNTWSNITALQNREMFLYAVCAGIMFAFGNLFLIYTISTKESLGNIRVIMAGIETFLLFLLGFFFFSEAFTLKKFAGIILILSGIYVVG